MYAVFKRAEQRFCSSSPRGKTAKKSAVARLTVQLLDAGGLGLVPGEGQDDSVERPLGGLMKLESSVCHPSGYWRVASAADGGSDAGDGSKNMIPDGDTCEILVGAAMEILARIVLGGRKTQIMQHVDI